MTHPHRWRLLAATSAVILALAASSPHGVAAHQLTYVIQPNDTLSGIALAYRTTVGALLADNELSSAGALRVGQRLLIQSHGTDGRGDRDGADRRAATPPAPTNSGAATGSAVIAPASWLYRVRPGDTLTGIAQRFGVASETITAANMDAVLTPLRVGLRLRVPTRAVAASDQDGSPAVAAAPTSTAPSGAPTATATAAATPEAASAGPAVQGGTIEALLTAQAQAAGVSVALVKAVAWQESGWRMINAADGGIGVMQLMPATVAWIDTTVLGTPINPYNAADNIRGGVALLRYYLRVFGGDQQRAIAAYNQGLGSVQTQGIGPATARYVANVLALEVRFSG